jgi:hypothetical protein
VLKYNASTEKWEGGSFGTLMSLDDVDLTSPTTGDILQYDEPTEKFIKLSRPYYYSTIPLSGTDRDGTSYTEVTNPYGRFYD